MSFTYSELEAFNEERSMVDKERRRRRNSTFKITSNASMRRGKSTKEKTKKRLTWNVKKN